MTNEALQTRRHSLAHVLAQTVTEHHPSVKLGFGPATEDGFYYDFDFGAEALEEKDLKKLEKTLRKLLGQKQAFVREELGFEAALAKVRAMGQDYKVQQVESLSAKGASVFSFYTNGGFTDLCEGPHVADTSELCAEGVSLERIAGAYWLGSEKNKMLTRIYAFAFPSKEELEDYKRRRKLAEERDHKKLGKELDLFMISDKVGKGLPMWLPNGWLIRDSIERYAIEKEFEYGYQRVATPHITREELYLQSQHLPAYKESMFPPMTVEEPDPSGGESRVKERYYLKPMNCPHHHMIYSRKPVSYRQLPLRLAEYGTCYRFEQSGELSGLLRVRCLSMNDAHIYLAEDMLRDEFRRILTMYQEFYKTFRLERYSYRFSTRGKERGAKYQGDDRMWDQAEATLKEVLEEMKIPYRLGEGEAAFYGPKIDVQFRNLLGREETVSTIQLDYLAPENFDLHYIGADGQEHRPVIIHRAPLSTHERFISFLIEYYGGAFPTWCSPVQAALVPVREEVLPWARQVEAELRRHQVRVEVDDSTDSLGKKVRHFITRKAPNILVLGDREAADKTVTWRRYGSEKQETLPFEKFQELLLAEIRTRSWPDAPTP